MLYIKFFNDSGDKQNIYSCKVNAIKTSLTALHLIVNSVLLPYTYL